MSNVIYLKNKVTGETKSIEKGFNWKVFLFGWIYLFIVGDYMIAVAMFVFCTIMSYFLMMFQNASIAIAIGCVILIINAIIAWNYHLQHQRILEKKDFEIVS